MGGHRVTHCQVETCPDKHDTFDLALSGILALYSLCIISGHMPKCISPYSVTITEHLRLRNFIETRGLFSSQLWEFWGMKPASGQLW
jgi:hypothetical protein